MVNGAVVRDPFPNNQVPRALWDAVARNTLDQGLWDTPELDRLLNNQPVLAACCPVFDQKTFATKIDQVIGSDHKASFYVNREWRTRNNSPDGRYGLPPGSPTNLYQLQKTPSWLIRATENWVVSDSCCTASPSATTASATTTAACTSIRAGRRSIGLTNVPDTTFPRFNFDRGGRRSSATVARESSGRTRAATATRAAGSSRTT